MKRQFALAVIATGPVISTPTDNGCPPEEHAVGWC